MENINITVSSIEDVDAEDLCLYEIPDDKKSSIKAERFNDGSMSWDDFKNNHNKMYEWLSQYELTNIRCPQCGQLIYKDNSKVLTSLPPQHEYVCKACNWHGYA